jgi:hypothetical protein
MGGRGTFASGNIVDYTYKTVDKLFGIKVLEGLEGKHDLPQESHSSNAYIKLYKDGNFQQLRVYDKEHYLKFELAYHPEPKLDPSRKAVLHYHIYDKKFERSDAIKATKAMKKHFGKFLKGVKQ